MVEHIRQRIQTRGPVTFAWFMEQALYHPLHGYYGSGRCMIGRHGDYYTSVSVGPLFGRLLAAQFAEMWTVLGRPNEFTIVEQGAHDGQFASDVLQASRQHHPAFFASLRYQIVEPFPILRTRQAESLLPFDEKVGWATALEELPAFCGVHFSNELLDAMPLHLLKWTGTEWLERHVSEREDRFVFVHLPLSTDALADSVRSVPMPLPAGYETEVNLAARDWISAVSPKLTNGFILAVDYGFPRDVFYQPQRTRGTVRSFGRHRVVDSPLVDVGRIDITAHVEWTTLVERAEAEGLDIAGFADQHHFITGLLVGELGEEFGPNSDVKTRRALQTLLHPNFLGMNFQFLALRKGLDRPALAGFRFAKEARAALGLTTTGTPASAWPVARPPA